MILEGLRVLDVGSYIAGPASTTVMADFGADVIKIEGPGGDTYRRLLSSPGMPASDVDYPWLLDNRSKRGIALDLKVPEGRAVLDRLIEGADVLVTNFPHDVVARLDLSWERCSRLNPRLIYAWLTGYGETGPDAGRPGFDTTAWWARSGLQDMVRAMDAPPGPSMPGMGDHPTAMSVFGAVMLGLYARERTGRGLRVGSSLLANGYWSNGVMVQAALVGAEFRPRRPREETLNALTGLYEAGDGRWFMLVLLDEERGWPGLQAACDDERLRDPRWATTEARRAAAPELLALLDEIFARESWAEWERRFLRHRVNYGPIQTLEDVPRDSHLREAGVLRPLAEAPGVGERGGEVSSDGAGDDREPLLTIDSPIWAEGVPKRPPGPAPALGAHSREILREAGYDDREVEELFRKGAVSGT